MGPEKPARNIPVNDEELPIRPNSFEVLGPWSGPGVLGGLDSENCPKTRPIARTVVGRLSLHQLGRSHRERTSSGQNGGFSSKWSALTGPCLGVDGRDGRPAAQILSKLGGFVPDQSRTDLLLCQRSSAAGVDTLTRFFGPSRPPLVDSGLDNAGVHIT